MPTVTIVLPPALRPSPLLEHIILRAYQPLASETFFTSQMPPNGWHPTRSIAHTFALVTDFIRQQEDVRGELFLIGYPGMWSVQALWSAKVYVVQHAQLPMAVACCIAAAAAYAVDWAAVEAQARATDTVAAQLAWVPVEPRNTVVTVGQVLQKRLR